MSEATPQPRPVEKVHRRLAELGWTIGNLAGRLRIKVVTLRNILAGNHPAQHARHRCERALGMVPIWSTPEEVARRQAALAFYGEDVRQMKAVELRALARRTLRAAGHPVRLCEGAGLADRLEAFAVAEGSVAALSGGPASDRSPEGVGRRIVAAMRMAELTTEKLAEDMGFKWRGVVSDLISGRDRSPRRRRLLENAMGGAAFWSTPEEVAAREPVLHFYGGKDPFTFSPRRLDALRVKHLVPAGVRGRLTRAALIAKLEEHARTYHDAPGREPRVVQLRAKAHAKEAAKAARKRRRGFAKPPRPRRPRRRARRPSLPRAHQANGTTNVFVP